MVFFKITNVEYNVLADIPSDGFEESIFGEWGCWVDPAVTRIVQTGVEQSRVPPLIECLSISWHSLLPNRELHLHFLLRLATPYNCCVNKASKPNIRSFNG